MPNSIAMQHNARVVNNYGPQKFNVYHGSVVTVWGAQSREHLDLLLRIEINMGYIKSISKVERINAS
jgi:acetylornithine/succinyldiaminopimelate/putrescine aminotransferase